MSIVFNKGILINCWRYSSIYRVLLQLLMVGVLLLDNSCFTKLLISE